MRTRIYFTSESHMHSLLNVLRFCQLGEPLLVLLAAPAVLLLLLLCLLPKLTATATATATAHCKCRCQLGTAQGRGCLHA